jgi:hypothetical protein
VEVAGPGLISGQAFCTLTTAHAANSLVDSSFGKEEDITSSPIDLDYLKSVNLLDRLPVWQKLIGQRAAE